MRGDRPIGSLRTLFALLLATARRASALDAPLFAAGVAFFVFLSLFPALIAAVFAYGIVADPETIARHGQRLAQLLPAEASPIVSAQLDALTANPPSTLGWGVLSSMAVALWSASRGAFHLLAAVERIFGLQEVRSTFAQRLLALAMMVGTVLFVVVSIGLVAALPPLLTLLELEGAWSLLRPARWLVLGLVVLAAIGLLFRLAERARLRPRALFSRGVIVATAMWIVVSFAFSVYVDAVANYARTYGAITGVVVLMIWIWLGTLSVLFGAAFEAVSEEREGGSPRAGHLS